MKMIRLEDDIHKELKLQALKEDMTITEYAAHLVSTEAKRIKAKELIKGK